MSIEDKALIAIEVLQAMTAAKQEELALRVMALPAGFIYDEQAERMAERGLDFAGLMQEAIEAIQDHFHVTP